MPDAEKLRSLRETLTEQERRLEELRLRFGSRATQSPPHLDHEHHAAHDAIASTMQTIRSLIDVLSEAGL